MVALFPGHSQICLTGILAMTIQKPFADSCMQEICIDVSYSSLAFMLMIWLHKYHMQREDVPILAPRPLSDFIILSMHVEDTILFVVAVIWSGRHVSCIMAVLASFPYWTGNEAKSIYAAVYVSLLQ